MRLPWQARVVVRHSMRRTAATRPVASDEVSGIRIVTWNVNKRADLRPHVAFLTSLEPDVVVLQEVKLTRIGELRRALLEGGWSAVVSSVDAVGPARLDHAVVVASGGSLDEQARPRVPWPESAVSVLVRLAEGAVKVTGAHVPTASPHRDVKVRTIKALVEHAASGRVAHQVLCGDMNTPRAEFEDGTIITFGQTQRRDGSFGVPPRLRDLDAAERSLFRDLPAYGVTDAFRSLHGFAERASSWRRFRLDHTFVSTGLAPITCRYHHDVVDQGLSDHAAMETELERTT